MVPVRRAVLRVSTTTEQVMVPVTVTRQHAHVEYVDVDPDDPGLPTPPGVGGPGTASGWLVLTADEPVVTTRAVPVERVRLRTGWVAGQVDVDLRLDHEEVTLAQDAPSSSAAESRCALPSTPSENS